MTEFVDVGLPTRVKAAAPDPNSPPQLPDDGYPKVILDQREMFGCDTVDEVRAYWSAFLARKNMGPKPDPEGRASVPYINQSRWVADCPACTGGAACWDQNPQACCLTCGTVFKVAWQLPTLRSAVIRELVARPLYCSCHPRHPGAHRNWNAYEGETLERLQFENRFMLGIGSSKKNGLSVADTVNLPDGFDTAQDYLEHLRTTERKAFLAGDIPGRR